MRRRTQAGRWLALGATAAVWVAACAAPLPLPPPPAPAAPPPPLYEEDLKPVETLKLDIVDVDELPGPDRKTVTVRGTLVNRGTRATREIYVHLEALDKDGAVVLSADPDPSTQVIAPASTATFAVTLENRTSVERYHVEAIGR